MVDLHCHYPMHVLAGDDHHHTLARIVRLRGRPWPDKLRALLVALFARLLNARSWSSGWRVDLEGLEQGGVRVALSVLYEPDAEIDFDEPYAAPPEDGYFAQLQQLKLGVEQELADIDPGHEHHAVVTTTAELDTALAGGRTAFVHCVEGGFHLGGSVADVDARVAWLARNGFAYVTLAHLFFRQVATNAPALPFLPDSLYDRLFAQPGTAGLTGLGEAAVRAMYRHRVLIDVSHMRQDALDRTFALLDDLDSEHRTPPDRFPVLASHAAYRIKARGQAYNLTEATARRIAARGGVIGLILAQHQLNEGVIKKGPKNAAESLEVICAHIDAIHAAVGSHRHTAFGTDLDGFIKPTMTGFDTAADLRTLRHGIQERYPADADAILEGNALRVLRTALDGRAAAPVA